MTLLATLTLIVQLDTPATWRCNGRLVEKGLTRLSVQKRCGEPVHVSFIPIRQEVDLIGGDGLTTVSEDVSEIWVYVPAGRLVRL
ncbi:MAG: DUF2845 domain-containing protein, partial [Myxococcota bacterium]